jgi:hypothetical protein
MAEITVAAGLFKPEIWAKELNRRLVDYGVMFDCVNKDWEGPIKNQGDTVHIQTPAAVTINTYVEDTDMVYENLKGDTLPLQINQAKYFGFKVPDIDKVQSNVNLMSNYTSEAKKEVINTKDAYLHALGIAAAQDAGTVAITADNIYGTLVDMYAMLADANAIDADGKAKDGSRPFVIVSPKVAAVIRKSAEATHATKLGDDTVRKGAILDFAGFDVKQSTLIKNDSGFSILAGTTEGITYAEQINKVRGLEDIKSFGTYVSGLYLYGGLAVQPKALVKATFTVA